MTAAGGFVCECPELHRLSRLRPCLASMVSAEVLPVALRVDSRPAGARQRREAGAQRKASRIDPEAIGASGGVALDVGSALVARFVAKAHLARVYGRHSGRNGRNANSGHRPLSSPQAAHAPVRFQAVGAPPATRGTMWSMVPPGPPQYAHGSSRRYAYSLNLVMAAITTRRPVPGTAAHTRAPARRQSGRSTRSGPAARSWGQ